MTRLASLWQAPLKWQAEPPIRKRKDGPIVNQREKEPQNTVNPMLGLIIAIAVGTALGVALDNLAVGVGVGAGVGVLFALGLRRRNESQDKSDGSDGDSAS